jgi:hypothetical protein
MQDLLVYIIVAGAAYYLGRTVWGIFSSGKSGCDGCGSGCASKAKPVQSSGLLQIELKSSKK